MPIWPRIRAGLIAVVLLMSTLEAVPMPSMKRRHLRRQMAGEELTRWSRILDSVGIEATESEIVDFGVAVSQRAQGSRWKVIRPWRLLERKLKMGQAWGMFAYTDNHPGRLIVEGSVDGKAWETLFRAPQSDRSRLTRTLQNRRVRGIYDDAGDRPNPGKLYGRWVDWLARRIFAERPALNHLRVRFDRMDVWPPGHPERTDQVQPMHEEERTRGGRR